MNIACSSSRSRARRRQPRAMPSSPRDLSRLIARAYERRFGLKNPQWRLLAVLADEGPLTQQTLCGRTIMDKVTVMRAARDLLRRRLVRKLPNAEDGRSHRLMLTSAGRRLYERIVPLALAYEAQLLSGIERREIVRLERLLRRVERAAGAQCQP